MNAKAKRIFAVLLAFTLLSNTHAQDCSQKLLQAEELYKAGQLNEVIQLIQSCSNSENETEQWKAHRLLAMVYIEQGENEKARTEAIHLLDLNPSYKGSPLYDPAEFIKLLKSITVIPKFSFGITLLAGVNSTHPDIRAGNYVTDTEKIYKGKVTTQFDFSMSYQFNKILSLQFSAAYSTKGYDLTYQVGEVNHKVSETLTYLNFPLIVRYHPGIQSRIRPFVQAGAYWGALIVADNSFVKESLDGNPIASLDHLDSRDRRNPFSYGLTFGLGAIYQLGPGQLFIQASYYRALNLVSEGEQGYEYNRLAYGYYYLDDQFTLHNTALGFGYSIYLNYKVLKE